MFISNMCYNNPLKNGGYMKEDNIIELDNESLVSLLQTLEQLDDECQIIEKDMEGDRNE